MMSKKDKIYHIISIISFCLHICVFIFVTVIGFLPFMEQQNFYDCFVGFFGNTLSAAQPYFVMVILFLSCVAAFLAINRPSFSFFVLACSLSFFVIATLPYSIEAMIVGFSSPWIGGSMSTFRIGFDLICKISYTIYFDMAFFIYSMFTLFIRIKKAHK